MSRRTRPPNATDSVASPSAATYRGDHRRTSPGALLASLPPVAFVLAVLAPAAVVAVAVALVVGAPFPLVLSRVRPGDGDDAN